jgi:peroxiredoxin
MQQTQRIIFYTLVLIAGAAWIILSADQSTTTEVSAAQVGFRAPEFELHGTDGKTYTLSDFRGYAVLVNLWTSWCPPCRAEMPAIETVYQEYKEKGFVVLAVNVTNQDDPAAISPFLDQYGISFPDLLDESGSVSRLFQLQNLPSSYFIDRRGIIREVVIGGPMSEALLRTRVEQILN